MKTKYPNLFGILAALMLVVSFVLPAGLASPTGVAADPGICKWDTLREPGDLTGTEVIARCSDPIDMAVGSDFNTIVVIVKEVTITGSSTNIIKWSNTKGLFWSSSKFLALARETNWTTGDQVISVAMAPDNVNFWAVSATFGGPGGIAAGPQEVWVTQNGGSDWDYTGSNIVLPGGETIRTMDISVDYGGKRDLAIGTVTGGGGGSIYVVKSTGFSGWQDQLVNDGTGSTIDLSQTGANPVDFFNVKFSPSYASDASMAVVFASATSTFYNVALRDIDGNNTLSWIFPVQGIEVKDSTWTTGSSPSFVTLRKASLALPSDFSGQAASLRRAYIATDAFGAAGKAITDRDGIFRIDDTTPYTLMDTSNIPTKSIYSIAYFGTYASGKMLAGEHMGYPCTATVPTWFTDSPTTCPIPCWYPCLKCPTGAACQGACTVGAQDGVGAAIVAWAPQGNLAYAITSSSAVGLGATWYLGLIQPVVAARCDDESAMSISRNNGETWNQISLIDTIISKFTDIAPTPDCKTIYLASVNFCTEVGCCAFDSVWRTSFNPDVTSPLAPQPVGTYWERVFTHVTAPDCTDNQTDYALLRVVPYCADPSGEIVAWAVYDPGQLNAHGVAAWSPDFGDYWAMLTPRNPVQDFCFESRTVLYFLSPDGLVQKMPYTGTAWSSSLPNADSGLSVAHTIAAYPEGKVLVGSGAAFNAVFFATSYCGNFNTDNPTFALQALSGNTQQGGNVHVAFDPNFKDNNTYFIGDDAPCVGSVFRNNPAAQLRWQDTDMMAAINGAIGCTPHPVGQYGIVLAFTGQALYTAHGACGELALVVPCGVDRTIDDGTGKFGPLSGIPKPGIAWDHLSAGFPAVAPCFTLEPSSLKICGCCTLDTDSTLYAIDDADFTICPAAPGYPVPTGVGLIWAFTDCLAKRGPALITEDNALIGCDPVSGRAQEVNLCWEQLCVADAYDIEISKNADFTIKVIDWSREDDCGGFLEPTDITAPCVFFPAGGLTIGIFDGSSSIALFGNLECGHTYYWRVKARECATTQVIRSPWSEARTFTVKAGLPVVSPYLGLQLLAPNNGCLGCPVSPASFSWSPFKETTKYKFVLAKDSEMTQVVKEAEVSTTAYEYDGTLDYSTNYFWRVMSEEPAPSDWSATFSFQTESQPAPVTPSAPAPTPIWVWVVIAIGAILVIVTLVLIFKTRRV
jgi:hypothetical protein